MRRLLVCPPDAHITGAVTSCEKGLYIIFENFKLYFFYIKFLNIKSAC